MDGAGSGVAQASLEPQASILEKAEEVAVVVGGGAAAFAVGCEGGGWDERLNAELIDGELIGAEDFCGADADGRGT